MGSPADGGLSAIVLNGAISPHGACMALGPSEGLLDGLASTFTAISQASHTRKPGAIPGVQPHAAAAPGLPGAPSLQHWLGEMDAAADSLGRVLDGLPTAADMGRTGGVTTPAPQAGLEVAGDVARLIASIEELKQALEARLAGGAGTDEATAAFLAQAEAANSLTH